MFNISNFAIAVSTLFFYIIYTEKPKFTIFAKLRFSLEKSESLWEFFAAKYLTLDELYYLYIFP